MDRFAEGIKQRLDRELDYRSCLFSRGYIVSDSPIPSVQQYPFYGLWQQKQLLHFSVYAHPDTGLAVSTDEDFAGALIGHAYDPISDEICETKLLKKLIAAYKTGSKFFYEALNNLTGVFVLLLESEGKLFAVQDCGGQKMLYYGKVGGHMVLTSAPQLAADVFHLEWDPDVERLVHSKGYFRGSGYLPGNLSPLRELKRLGCNTALEYVKGHVQLERIYPLLPRMEFKTEEEKDTAIEEMYNIFSNNIALAMKKWPRVGLSLTGGMDSKTTFACAKPYYGKFFCYSFESKNSEKLDADAAAQICAAVGISHHRYQIPSEPEEIPDYEFLRQIIEHNTSHTCKLHSNEIRKYIWLRAQNDFDVEIKSDMSEVGRAYTSRKYSGVKLPRVLDPRHLTITQGRYFLEPWAMRFADKSFRAFMTEIGLQGDIQGYSMHDLVYWEVRMSSWAATSFASQEFFHEITIPYNNRRLLDLFLRFPEKERLVDGPHKRLMRRGNPVVADLDLSVKDSYLGKKRMFLETAYYYYATRGNTLGHK